MAVLASNNPIDLSNTNPTFDLGGGTIYTNVPATLTADILGDCTLQFFGAPTVVTFTGTINDGIQITIDEASVTDVSAAITQTQFDATITNAANYNLELLVGYPSFVINNSLGNPIEHARVVLKETNGTIVTSDLTDVNGEVSFDTTTSSILDEKEYHYDVFHERFFQSRGNLINVTEPSNNQYTLALANDFGYKEDLSIKIRKVDGHWFDSDGVIDLDFTAKTIDFTAQTDITAGLSAVKRDWVIDSNLYSRDDNQIPFDIADPRGISIISEWHLNRANVLNGGYAEFDANGNYSEVDLTIETELNPDTVPMFYRLNNDGVKGAWTELHTGANDTVVSTNVAATTIELELRYAYPGHLIKYSIEQFKYDATTYTRAYKNVNKIWNAVEDSYTTNILPDDPTKYRAFDQAIQRFDVNNTEHNFDKVIDITDVSSIEAVYDQLKAVACYNPVIFNSEPFVSNGTVITINEGVWVRNFDGTDLSGNVIGWIQMSSADGGDYQFPASTTLTLSNISDIIDCSYVVVDTDTLGTANAATIMKDLSNNNHSGSISAGQSIGLVFEYLADMNLTVFITGNNVESERFDIVLGADGELLEIEPATEVIDLYRDETLHADDPVLGLKVWDSRINDVTIVAADKQIIIPNTIEIFHGNYAYRAWKKWVDADVERIAYGIAVRGINQSKPEGSSDNQHLWNPQYEFGYDWFLNTDPTRSPNMVFEMTSSGFQRDHTNEQTTSDVVYIFPLAHGGAATINIAAGASTEFQKSNLASQARQEEALFAIKNFNNFMASIDANMLGIKPGVLRGYDPDTEY